ncbi:MAG: mechanosensitive ion channel [Pseudomonadales bacterium]|nr:mechanosensitive ion channel [Pseudomonadales bacterium]
MEAVFRLELGVAILVGVLAALLILLLRPAHGSSARNTLGLLLLCVLAELLAVGSTSMDYPRAARIAANFASFVAGVALIRVGALVLFRVLFSALGLTVVRIAEDLVTAGVLLVWGFIWLGLAGVDLASLVTTSAVITGVIAFSMQDTLGNILGGIVLQLDESMKVGDWVQIDDVRGRVTDVRWRFTAIETRNRETVFVPNSALVKHRFTVLGSRADGEIRWRRWVWFAIDLDTTSARVCSALEQALQDAEIPFVAREPAPSAVLMDVTEGYARYALRYWLCEPREDDGTDSRVRAHALAALERAGIHLSVRREERLVVMAEDETRRAALAADEQARRLSALERVPLFASLSDAEKSEVARHLMHAPFLQGDVVTRQGAVAHWLYLIISGDARICDDAGGERRTIAPIGPGEVFGERGMLTGEPRSATVIATSDLECYRLDKAGFEGVIHARPDIAEEMSRILTQRATELDAWRAAAHARGGAPAATRNDVLAHIRRFFGID